jgi:hypothetical protein
MEGVLGVRPRASLLPSLDQSFLISEKKGSNWIVSTIFKICAIGTPYICTIIMYQFKENK